MEPLDLSRAERVYRGWPQWKQKMANQILRPTPNGTVVDRNRIESDVQTRWFQLEPTKDFGAKGN